MNHTIRNRVLVLAILALAGASSAWAVCPAAVVSQPVWHGFGGYIVNCPDATEVSGTVYALSSPSTINSGTQSNAVVCEEGNVLGPLGLNCQGDAQALGDGIVTVLYEFGAGNPGSVGCPNSTESGPDGSFPVAVDIVCNNGASLHLETGYLQGLLMYLLEQTYDNNNTPYAADFLSGPSLTSFASGSPNDTVCVHVNPPHVHSDCDADTQGSTSSCPDPLARPARAIGQLYYQEAPCATSPDPRFVAPWALTAVQPDASGNACNSIPHPATGNCGYLGSTGKVGTLETPGMIGWLQVGGPTASNDKVKIDKAEFAQGKLIVDFSTTNETSIVGFNVYTGATKLNGSLIAAKGAGSNAYTFEVGRGALKGGKSVLVEAVKSDGSVEKTTPVTLK